MRWRVWFPEGPTAHSRCFIQLRPVPGEFRSTQGIKGLRYAFDAAKADVTGAKPKTVPGQHGEVGVPHARRIRGASRLQRGPKRPRRVGS
jgi:hypothetical protein